MEDGKNWVSCLRVTNIFFSSFFFSTSLMKEVEITGEKADTIYLALSNGIGKCDGVESLNEFGSDEASVIIGHKKVISKIKKG